MKKIILATMCSLLALTAVGCGTNNETQTLNDLDTKLDRVSTIVANTSTTEVNTVSPLEIDQFTQTTPTRLQAVRHNAYNNMVREEELRQEVLSTASYLKSNIDKKYKLGKSKRMALRSLTDSLETYVSDLAGTKLAVKNNVNKIQRYTKAENIDANRTRSSYNELNNLMQARATYLTNLQNTMYEICDILNESVVEEDTQEAPTSKQITDKTVKKHDTIRRNIDTYNNKVDQKETKSQENTNNNETINTSYYNNYPNRPYHNYYNNYYNNFYNRGYRYNPNRNTDTFYPRVKNIDTYRFNPYNGNPYYYNNGYEYNQINETMPVNKQDDLNDNCYKCDNCNDEGCENCQECSNDKCIECFNPEQEDKSVPEVKQNKVISITDQNTSLDADYLTDKIERIKK